MYQVEQAVKRVKTEGGERPEDRDIVARLRALLDEAEARDGQGNHRQRNVLDDPSTRMFDDDMDEGSSNDDADDASDMGSTPELTQANEDPLAVDDAENPLQLLARASYFQPPEEPRNPPPPQPPMDLRQQLAGTPGSGTAGTPGAGGSVSGSKDLHGFFAPARVNLDVGEDVDPVYLGLATLEEAEALFAL